MCVTWLVRICHMPHSCVWHASFMCVTWLIRPALSLAELQYVWRDSFMSVKWLIHMCDMPHSSSSFSGSTAVCDTWLIHTWDWHHSNAWRGRFKWLWHYSFSCVRWLIQMCCMTHSHVRHDSFICVTWLFYWPIQVNEWVMSHIKESCHIWMSRVTNMNESCRTCEWVVAQIWMSHDAHVNE